jgi:hypothetical protein
MNLLNSTQLCQLLLSLIIAYTVHECGHYFFARLFGVFVQRFVVFLDVGLAGYRLEDTSNWMASMTKPFYFIKNPGRDCLGNSVQNLPGNDY